MSQTSPAPPGSEPVSSYRPSSPVERSLLVILVILFLYNCQGWLTRGYDYDEIVTAKHYVEVDSFWTTVSTYHVFNNHIGYSILARVSLLVFGRHEWALRLPALGFGIATILYFWWMSRTYLPRPWSLVATGLFALSPVHLFYSCSARGYSGMEFMVLVSLHQFLLARQSATPRRLALYLASTVAAIYLHAVAVATYLVQILFWMGTRRFAEIHPRRRLDLALLGVAVCSLALYSPVAGKVLNNVHSRGAGEFQPWFPLEVLRLLCGSLERKIQFVLLVSALFGLGRFFRARTAAPPIAGYLGLLFTVPLLSFMLLHPFDSYARFFEFLLPPWILLVTSGLCLAWTAGRIFRIPVAVLVAVVACQWWSRCQQVTDSGYRAVAALLQAPANSRVLECAVGGWENFQYYQKTPLFIPRSREEWEDRVKEVSEVRCACTPDIDWSRAEPLHLEIFRFLEQHAEAHKVENFVVYVWHRQ